MAQGTAEETESQNAWQRIRSTAGQLTTPLHPDDYLRLLNPLWSSRELRGRIEKVIPETDDAATLVIRPGWGWRYTHSPGQYVGIGVPVDGKFQWRSYSISSPPERKGRTITITVRAMPEGLLSSHLVKGLDPGTIVRLALPKGDFVLPDPPPEKMLFLVAGSGITPVMAMIRTLDRRGTVPDVVMHYSSPTPERMIYRDELDQLAEKHESLTLHKLYTDTDGILDLADLDDLCPDWRERETWACGPSPMLDAAEEHWTDADIEDQLHLERFTLEMGGDAEGGTITFRNSNKTVEADGATTILEAGEEAGIGMPYGCRMGICHTCTITLVEGKVKDLRNGEEYSQPNEQVQTCITAAMGDCTWDI
jgi:ferredoxin-NADP reductase